jgi:uncharacterized protein (TIGR03435 family)
MRRCVAAIACLITVLVGAHAGAQSPAPAGPRFEVASVKPGMSPFDAGRAAGASGGRVSFPFFGVRTRPGGRLEALANLQGLILSAYRIESYQIEGGPKWLTTDYFEIAAKAERETATDAELFEMLKSLLAERFGLRVHVETRQASVFMLSARADGRLGAGLKRTSSECERDLEERKRTGASPPPQPRPSGTPPRLTPACGMASNMITAAGVETWAMGGRPFTELVSRLSSELKAPVVDRTGLTGLFDVLIEFESKRRLPAARPPGLDVNSTDPLPVPLPAAVQQQLGLTLEKRTGPLPITIVDAAEPPSAN